METIFTERHKLRNSKTELYGGQWIEPFERPSRAEYIIGRVREVDLGPVTEPDDFGMNPILTIHDASFIEFLQVAYVDWKAKPFQLFSLPAVCLHAFLHLSKGALDTMPYHVKPLFPKERGRLHMPLHRLL